LARGAVATARLSGCIAVVSAGEYVRRAEPGAPVSCLHVFPSFEIGGVPLRTVRIINHLGSGFRHTVIALDNNYSAAERLAPAVTVSLFPPRRRIRGSLRAAFAAARVLRRLRPDLLLTYNWGAMDWAIVHRLSPIVRHIHFESGFGKEEADTQLRRRVLGRRWALARCARIVVPSRRLEDLARRVWKLPTDLVTYLPNGVDTVRFAATARATIPGFTRRPGELVIGTVAPLRAEKNLGRLLRVFALLGDRPMVRLVVAGDGSERARLARLASELGIAERVVFTGQVQPEAVLGTFDVFTLSSDTEQMPNALLEAMAASRAVAAVDVGDVKAMVCAENRSFIVPRDDASAFAGAIARLLRGETRRRRLGQGNRERAVAEFSQDRMFAAYARLFADASAKTAALTR
jgi:glycosyltransferase involved in cell wall biosynthesis